MGREAFSYCRALKTVRIPDSVTTIGPCAFDDCVSLEKVTLGRSLAEFDGGYTFYNCSNLTEIYIPQSDRAFEWRDDIFEGCPRLTRFVVGEENEYYKAIDGHLYSGDGTVLFKYATGQENTSFTLPDGVTTICVGAFKNDNCLVTVDLKGSLKTLGAYAFAFCSNLETVEFGESLETIGAHAFASCASLSSITIPDSVTSIGEYAFTYAVRLSELKLGSSLEKIDSFAFSYCYHLTEVTLPARVMWLGKSAFGDCIRLSSLTFEDPTMWYSTSDPSTWEKRPVGRSGEVFDNEEIIRKYFATGTSTGTAGLLYWYKR